MLSKRLTPFCIRRSWNGSQPLCMLLACLIQAVWVPSLATADEASVVPDAAEPIVMDLWPAEPPGWPERGSTETEIDRTESDDKLIAGRRVIRLGNVTRPQIAVYRPAAERANGTAVVICPGGGHHILAYDLEGTEIAAWLNQHGVTGIVLKYRVPFRDKERRWIAAVQDAQRAMSLVRANADQWQLSPDRIGMIGFSAGGETAALTSLFLDDRQYESVDEIDSQPSRSNFTMLVYPGGLTDGGQPKLRDHIQVAAEAPPMFFVHAFDDRVSVLNSLILASELKQAGVPAELHVYPDGGHGYGMRPTDQRITRWPEQATGWLKTLGMLDQPKK